jgi:hypothetical protein
MKIDRLESAAMIVRRGNYIVGEWALPTGGGVVLAEFLTTSEPSGASTTVAPCPLQRQWTAPLGGDNV